MTVIVKTKSILSATAFLLVGVILAPGAVADHKNCDGDVWGWKKVQESCEYFCDDGDTVFVVAQQEDDDKSTSTKGEAGCSTAWADCTGTDSCSARGVTPAAQDDHGFCLGTFYSSYWTDGHVYCGAGDGVNFDSPVQVDDVLDQAVEILLGPDGLAFLDEVLSAGYLSIEEPRNPVTLQDRMDALRTSDGAASCMGWTSQDHFSFTRAGVSGFRAIVLEDGVASGVAWDSEHGCRDVQPHCSLTMLADEPGLVRSCSL